MVNIKNLTFSYKKNLKLFDSLDLELMNGSVYGLLGKNGAGKTTLLKILSGLRFPDKGTCKVLGFETKTRTPEFLKDIYIISEEFFTPSVSMKEYVDIFAPFYPNFSLDQLNEYSREFELPETGKLSALSYGQKKKFLISFGLATNCKLLILDEPTNGLDIPSKSKLRKVLATAVSNERTFIISTHQVRDIDKIIDPIIILEQGKVIFNQPIENISNKLLLKITQDEPGEEALYFEKGLGGYLSVEENLNNEPSNVDIELLFNAVISNQQKINRIFNN